MIQIPLNQVQDDLSRYLRMAEKEDIVITRHGVPAGILIGFEDPEAWWEELLLRDPRFRARVAQARSSLRDGQGISIEQLREKHSIKSQAPQAEE
jgi:prevent-host-death family protein